MKQGTVKYSEEFANPIGLKKWYGIELPFDVDTENPVDVFNRAKVIVSLAAGVNPLLNENSIAPAPPTELPVINKAEERLGILIENASTKEELMNYKNDLTSPYLTNLFSSKLANFKK